MVTSTAQSDGLRLLSAHNDHVVGGWELPTSSSSFTSPCLYLPSTSSSTMASTTACFTSTEREGGSNEQENFSLSHPKEQKQKLNPQSSSFFNGSSNKGEASNGNEYFQVSALSLQKYQDFMPYSFLHFNDDINKNGPSNTKQNENDDADDTSLKEKSEMSSIFDNDEEMIAVNSSTKNSTFSTPTMHNINSSTTNNLEGTFFDGQDEGNEDAQEQNLIGSGSIADVLGSVTTLLDGSANDNFRNIITNNSSDTNIYHYQAGFLSNYISSSTPPAVPHLIEPTPMSTEPGRIQVIPKISSITTRQEGPSLLSPMNWYFPSNYSSKGFNGANDHDDIQYHVIKALLNHQQQNSPPSRHNQVKYDGDETPAAAHQITDDGHLSPCQEHSSSFASKKRSIPREWNDEEDDNEDNDDSWFTKTVDGNTIFTCSQLEHAANEGITAQPPLPPPRKRSRTDNHDSNTVVFQSEYLENDNLKNDCTITEENNNNRFRLYQAEQWWQRLKDMMEFQKMYGHCNVPNTFPQNPILAQWVKRQRYQYKLKQEGKRSTLTDERENILQNMGFIWDSHAALWEERWNELKAFYDKVGHSSVPTHYEKNRQLAIWVKCQRRQYKLYVTGDPKSNMTVDRIRKLELLDFVWHPKVGAKSAKEKEQYIIL